jgi:hypothetical protein
MILKNKTKLISLVISLFLLSFLFSPFVNRYEEENFQEKCKEDWYENYKYLQDAYDDLSINIWRPEEFLMNAYGFARAWYDAEGYECFANNPSERYLNAFVVVLREYERQISLGAQLSPPELPFSLLEANEESHVTAFCTGWMFTAKEERCDLVFNLAPKGFYRTIVSDFNYE